MGKFDEVFQRLESPDYPATCNECGLEGTNVRLEGHVCTRATQELSIRMPKPYPGTPQGSRVEANQSPALRAGEGERDEWYAVNFTRDGANEWMVITGTGRSVALANTNDTCQAESEMRMIATEHNQHSTLLAQRDRLLEALKDLVRQLPTDERLADYNLDLAESVIATIEQEEKS